MSMLLKLKTVQKKEGGAIVPKRTRRKSAVPAARACTNTVLTMLKVLTRIQISLKKRATLLGISFFRGS